MHAELMKKVRLERSYWVSLVADQLLFIFGFLIIAGLFDLVTGGHFDRWARLSSLVGYLTWRVAGGCMVETAVTVAADAEYGTLEQVWSSGAPPAAILLARSVIIVAYYTLRVLIMAAIIMPLLRIPVPFAPGALIVYLLTLVGAFGLAFAIAGLHLVLKNVEAIAMPLATALLFFTGALSSLEGVPGLYTVSRFLPLSTGIDLLRAMLVAGQPLGQVMAAPEFVWLLVNTAVYLTAGLAVFHRAQRHARVTGSLGHY